MDFGIANVAAITVISFLVCQAIKQTPLDSKWIPAIAGVVGLILGLVAFFTKMPDFPAGDAITAAAVGIVSGFAATGVHQVYNQLTKDDETK